MVVTRLRPVVFAAVASLLWLAAPSAQAATMRYADVSALTQHSDVVVRGRIVDADVYLDESNGHITTRWTLAVEESLKGDVTGTVSFTQWGGQLNGVIERIPGDATFSRGLRTMTVYAISRKIHPLTQRHRLRNEELRGPRRKQVRPPVARRPSRCVVHVAPDRRESKGGVSSPKRQWRR